MHGAKICKGAPIISHLLFVDDSFLFFRASKREAMVMKNILSDFEIASGQAINLQKSEVFFSRNVDQAKSSSISNILGVNTCLGTGKYLGLPTMIARSKKSTFGYLKDRVWTKLSSWSGNFFIKRW